MLNELLRFYYACPVCGRILYQPRRGYWCPFCGTDLDHNEPVVKKFSEEGRITARAESGLPYYIGPFTMRERAFAQDLNLTAIAEILEKLCQYEELEEENANGSSEEEDNG